MLRRLALVGLTLVALRLRAEDWRLVWADEFDHPGAPDPSHWTYETGFVRNHEPQYYTRARLENARIEDDGLRIEARKEPFEGAPYSSASLTTKGIKAWKYGRIEVCAKIPQGVGIWPAIWMLGENHDSAHWPRCGEIDIMEFVGYMPDTIHGNLHNLLRYDKSVPAANVPAMGAKLAVERPFDAFHVYGVTWDSEKLEFSFDGKVYYTYVNPHTGVEAWPYDQPFYLILNVAVGGPWAVKKGIDPSIFPQSMHVRYVRVYQKAG